MRVLAGLAAVGLAACGGDDAAQRGEGCAAFAFDSEGFRSVCVRDPWVRPVGEGANATAAYFVIETTVGRFDLVSVRANGFASVELHESRTTDGVSRMRQVDRIRTEADASTVLEPGGLHAMLIGPARPLAEGDTVAMALTFDVGGTLAFDAPVRRQAGPAMDHGAH